MRRGYSSSKSVEDLESPGKKAAKPEAIESDREITITFTLKTHGSIVTTNALIQYIKRQLSVMLHRDVEITHYDVNISKDENGQKDS